MSFCHECGSEVAPNDAFCAYCGIAIQSANGDTLPTTQPEVEALPVAPKVSALDATVVAPFLTEPDSVTLSGDLADTFSDEKPPSPLPVIDEYVPIPLDEIPTPNFSGIEKNWSANSTPKFELGDTEPTPYFEASQSRVGESDKQIVSLEPEKAVSIANHDQSSPIIEEEIQKPQVVQDSVLGKSLESKIESEDEFSLPQSIPEFTPKDVAVGLEEEEKSDILKDEAALVPNYAEVNEKIPESVESDEVLIEAPKPLPEVVIADEKLDIEPIVESPIEEKPVEDFPIEQFKEYPVSKADSSDENDVSAKTYGGPTIKPNENDGRESDMNPEAKLVAHDNEQQSATEKIADNVVLENVLSSEMPTMISSSRLPIIPQNVVGSIALDDQAQPSGVIEEPPVVKEVVPEPEPESNLNLTSQNVGNETGSRKGAKLQPLLEGTILLNRYEVVRKIGGGGMGAVYLASDRNLGGVLRAVKEMVQSHIEEEQQEKAVADFKRESLLLTSLEHPSIPTIYDYFFDEDSGRFYLVMKYISGGDLASRLRSAPDGKLDEKSVTEWAVQVADVLDYLHNHQPPIVYRDLKPSNVMIDGNNGRAMLIDFGIARWVSKEEKGVTAVGTMGYAPPELFSGNAEPRSDIYGLGSTMFHILTGGDPQNNPLLIFDFNKNKRPRQLNPQLSDQMEKILMRSVEYNAEMRFDSAAEMRDSLLMHLDSIRSGHLSYNSSIAEQGTAAAPPVMPTGQVFCGFCGGKILAADTFCAYCGSQQPRAEQAPIKSAPIAPKNLGRISAKMVIIGTNELDAPTYSLDKESNLVGRRDPQSNIFPEVDLTKFDPTTKISRRNSRIWQEGDTFMIEDLGATNGTTLISKNGESSRLLPHQPHVLTHGDKIKVGDVVLHFIVG